MQAESLVCQRGAGTRRYALRVAAPQVSAPLGSSSVDAAGRVVAGLLTVSQNCSSGDRPCSCELWRRFVAFTDGYALQIDVDLINAADCQLAPITAHQRTPAASEPALPTNAMLGARSAAIALGHGAIAAVIGVSSASPLRHSPAAAMLTNLGRWTAAAPDTSSLASAMASTITCGYLSLSDASHNVD